MEHLTGYVRIVRSTKQVTPSGSPARPSGVSEPNVATSVAESPGNQEIFAARECLSRAYLRKGTATTKSRENPAENPVDAGLNRIIS